MNKKKQVLEELLTPVENAKREVTAVQDAFSRRALLIEKKRKLNEAIEAKNALIDVKQESGGDY